MIHLHGDGWSNEKKASFVSSIRLNLISYIQTLSRACQVLQENAAAKVHLDSLGRLEPNEYRADVQMDATLVSEITNLWNDPNVKALWASSRADLQLPVCSAYYLDRLSEISLQSYLPSFMDLLQCRVSTTGIVQASFAAGNEKFEMYDVGGQKNERKKWIHSFEGVALVIFVVAVDQFDQGMFEHKPTNRMTDALNLFEDTCNNQWFHNKDMVLFLNRRDLFAEKIKTMPLSTHELFRDFDGGSDYAKSMAFIKAQFVARSKNKDRRIDVFETCCTDTDTVDKIFESVRNTLLKKDPARAAEMKMSD